MKTIKIKFTDWYPTFKENDNSFLRRLQKYYNVELSDNPDYVFYSTWGTEHLKYDCIKIFYTAEDISPDFNLCDYAIGFDDIKFGDRYLRFSLFPIQDAFPDAVKKHEFTQADIDMKTEFCDYLVSNAKADPLRTEVFKKLSKYKRVDSGGKYMNNIGGIVENKLEFQKKHKFSIAFENGAMKGYTSEKIVHPFSVHSIPIYWGNPDIALDFNTKSFINYWDFNNLDDMIDYVIKVDNDDELYYSILREPIFEGGKVPERFTPEYFERFLCHIFDQPLESASRRCMYTWRRVYVEDMKRYAELDKKSKKLPFKICNKLF